MRTRLLLAVIFLTPGHATPDDIDPKPGTPERPLFWRNPADIATRDLRAGAGGPEFAPQSPFQFEKEDMGGTTPKVLVVDAAGRTWSVKWGEEAKPEVFANRIVWAVGYFVEPSYFVKSGRILGADRLKRAAQFVAKDGSFQSARFELRDPKYVPVPNQNWTFPSMAKLPSFKGMKVMMMLLSNWDVKDARSSDPNPNTSVMARQLEDGSRQIEYVVNDWGATMGRWGGVASRSKWDCKGYTEQTRDFVRGVKGGFVQFGYEGKRSKDIRTDITPGDVQWLMLYLGKLTDAQIRDALAAAGATPEEMECFGKAVRARIDVLRTAISENPPA